MHNQCIIAYTVKRDQCGSLAVCWYMPGLRVVYGALRRVPGVGVAENSRTPKRKGIAIYTHVHEIILREKGAGKVTVGVLEYGSWKNFKPSQRSCCL